MKSMDNTIQQLSADLLKDSEDLKAASVETKVRLRSIEKQQVSTLNDLLA